MLYTGEHTNEICFPLGGIGSGSVGFAGNGRLTDWEIFNRPNKGGLNGHSHIAIRTQAGGKAVARVCQGDLATGLSGLYYQERYRGFGFGPCIETMCGLPHFRRHSFRGEFPVALLSLSDDDFPADVTVTAFSPFIPLDDRASSLPVALFEVEVANRGDEARRYEIAFTVGNPFAGAQSKVTDRSVSYIRRGEGDCSLEDGDITVATDCPDCRVQEYWYRGAWQDGIVTFWNEFSSGEPLCHRHYDGEAQKTDHGTVCAAVTAGAGERRRVRFVLAWNVPNRVRDWEPDPGVCGCEPDPDSAHPFKNYYATLFPDSSAVADYVFGHYDDLRQRTFAFRDALFASTVDPAVLDAASSCLSVLRSPTVMRLTDGSFYGFEGVHEKEGSCEGTCQHVYTYAYALCYLFPQLERSIRDLEFDHSTDRNGRMQFRLRLPLGHGTFDRRACLDGQMGAVFKSYREWKLSGDSDWLRRRFSDIRRVLDYATSPENEDGWDRDGDGVLEGRQHHTLDMELFGPSSWLEGMYLLALRCGVEMADFVGDRDSAARWQALYRSGAAYTKQHLFDGTHFIQRVDLDDLSLLDRYPQSELYRNTETGELKYQIGEGSSIDQLLGRWHAGLLGVPGIFDDAQVQTALDYMMEHNFRPRMREFANPWRVFSLNDEAGSVICVYPEGTRKPKIPIPYCEETMTGFEYSFAGLLLQEGHIEDGLRVVRAVRDRFNGKNRNPYNEFECGSNYARSMAAFALLPILSGFSCDLPAGRIGFAPRVEPEHCRHFFSTATGFGSYCRDSDSASVSLLGGSLRLSSLSLPYADAVKKLQIDGQPVDFTVSGGALCFSEQTVTKGISLSL